MVEFPVRSRAVQDTWVCEVRVWQLFPGRVPAFSMRQLCSGCVRARAALFSVQLQRCTEDLCQTASKTRPPDPLCGMPGTP